MSPAKGHQDGHKATAHNIKGEAEGARPAEPGEMKTERRPQCLQRRQRKQNLTPLDAQ